MANQYPVGNVVECRFCFTNRALTLGEDLAFLAGGGLPAGVGVDQTTVTFHYAVNNAATVTTTVSAHDTTGAYHGMITVTEPGDYRYWGSSVDGSSNPVAATQSNHFMGVVN
jgi:hypothetical protein